MNNTGNISRTTAGAASVLCADVEELPMADCETCPAVARRTNSDDVNNAKMSATDMGQRSVELRKKKVEFGRIEWGERKEVTEAFSTLKALGVYGSLCIKKSGEGEDMGEGRVTIEAIGATYAMGLMERFDGIVSIERDLAHLEITQESSGVLGIGKDCNIGVVKLGGRYNVVCIPKGVKELEIENLCLPKNDKDQIVERERLIFAKESKLSKLTVEGTVYEGESLENLKRGAIRILGVVFDQ